MCFTYESLGTEWIRFTAKESIIEEEANMAASSK